METIVSFAARSLDVTRSPLSPRLVDVFNSDELHVLSSDVCEQAYKREALPWGKVFQSVHSLHRLDLSLHLLSGRRREEVLGESFSSRDVLPREARPVHICSFAAFEAGLRAFFQEKGCAAGDVINLSVILGDEAMPYFLEEGITVKVGLPPLH